MVVDVLDVVVFMLWLLIFFDVVVFMPVKINYEKYKVLPFYCG